MKSDFKNRKIINSILIVLIIALQVIALLVWYNETSNENKLMKSFDNSQHANNISNQTTQVNMAIMKSQDLFSNYLQSKKESDLNNYFKSISNLKLAIDSLKINTSSNKEFHQLLLDKKNTEKDIVKLNSTIDSIMNTQINSSTNEIATNFEFNPFLYNKILDSIKTKTYISVDSVAKRGLLSRLVNAFSGKI